MKREKPSDWIVEPDRHRGELRLAAVLVVVFACAALSPGLIEAVFGAVDAIVGCVR